MRTVPGDFTCSRAARMAAAIAPALALALALCIPLQGCRAQEPRVERQPAIERQPGIDRQPAVAGSFYPADSALLRGMLGELFRAARPSAELHGVCAIIAPHAGYVYSGAVAAAAFRVLDAQRDYETVFLLGSSHLAAFDGAAVYRAGDFYTPLGRVPVDRVLADSLIAADPLFRERNDAHLREHSLEVQLPFLQYRLAKPFRIVPIILGTQSPAVCRRIAQVLKPFLAGGRLLVVSSDFSHYPSYADAHRVDSAMGRAVLARSPAGFVRELETCERARIPELATAACGWSSILTLLDICEGDSAVHAHWLDSRNSGDTRYGDRNRVVGYNAFAFTRSAAPGYSLAPSEQKALLALARRTIASFLETSAFPAVDTAALAPALRARGGAFVTLRHGDDLRGCIGRFDAELPLYRVVRDMAVAAATRDTRFAPVETAELSGLTIEISVLTPMRRIASADEFELGRHGIYMRKGGRAGTFLPQVAEETRWTREEFLGHCARDKAGIGWDGWKDAELYVYEAYVFGE